MQVLPQWTKLRPSTPLRPPYLHGLSIGSAARCISGLPVSVRPAAVLRLPPPWRPSPSSPPGCPGSSDPACSEQPCVPLSRPHRPAPDAQGLQSLQGGGCAGGWVPSPACTFSTGIRDRGLGLPKPHTGTCTGVPCTHLGVVGTKSLPPLCLEGRLGPRVGQGSASGLQATLWWGLPAAGTGCFSCSVLALGPRHYIHAPTQLFIHQPTHLFISSFTHSPLHSFTHSTVHSFTHSPVHSFIHPLTCSFVHPLTCSFTHSLTHSFIHPLTHLFPHSLIHLLLPSLPPSVAHGHLPGAGPPGVGHQTGRPWKVGAHVLGEAGIDWIFKQRSLQLWWALHSWEQGLQIGEQLLGGWEPLTGCGSLGMQVDHASEQA